MFLFKDIYWWKTACKGGLSSVLGQRGVWEASALTIAEKRQNELSICHPGKRHGSWRGEMLWSSSVCAGKRSVYLQQLWGEIKVCSVVYTHVHMNTHTNLYKKIKCLWCLSWTSSLVDWEQGDSLTRSKHQEACLYWFKSLPLNYTYCICMVLCWSLSLRHLKDFWALWIGNDWQAPLTAYHQHMLILTDIEQGLH